MIEIENLTFGYKKGEELFDELSLRLEPGNIYGLLGKNGAGKSTFLKIMSGLLFPKDGKLDVVGYTPKDRLPDFLQEIYLVTEEFHLPSMKIKSYVKYYSGFYPRFSHEQFGSYLHEFSLKENQKLDKLSYGQKKKFLLSFGLATDCKLLVLDEPTNGLDIPSKSQFRKVVANAIHEERSFIISTHQARDMENLIDPIIIMDEGQIVFFHDQMEIAQKLTVSKLKELPADKVVYSESTFGGFKVVQENKSSSESNMNLELLFNAVVNNKEEIHQIFKR